MWRGHDVVVVVLPYVTIFPYHRRISIIYRRILFPYLTSLLLLTHTYTRFIFFAQLIHESSYLYIRSIHESAMSHYDSIMTHLLLSSINSRVESAVNP